MISGFEFTQSGPAAESIPAAAPEPTQEAVAEAVASVAQATSEEPKASFFAFLAAPVFAALRTNSRPVDARNRWRLSRLPQLLESVGAQASVHIARGPVKAALLDAAQQCGADALLIGRPRGAGLPDLTYSLIRDSPVPVVSV